MTQVILDSYHHTYEERVAAARDGKSKPLIDHNDPWNNDDPRIAGWHGRWCAMRNEPRVNPYPATSKNGVAWAREYRAKFKKLHSRDYWE